MQISTKQMTMWIFQQVFNDFPEVQSFEFMGFKVRHVDQIVMKRLEKLPPARTEKLLEKLYKGLKVYYGA